MVVVVVEEGVEVGGVVVRVWEDVRVDVRMSMIGAVVGEEVEEVGGLILRPREMSIIRMRRRIVGEGEVSWD